MDNRIVQAILVLVGVPAVLVGYIALIEWLIGFLPEKYRPRVRPWLWLAPALAFLTIFLVYPALNTIGLSFQSRDSTKFVGLDNYVYAFTNHDFLIALRNNGLWIVFFTLFAATIGLLIAVLADRVPYESGAKALIFLPGAISFVAAGVIWKFMYDYRPPGTPQTGTVNAVLTTVVT